MSDAKEGGRYRLRDVDISHPAMQVAMPLVSEAHGDAKCIGTAFLVAPGLAITASHVAEAWAHGPQDSETGATPTFSANALQMVEGKVVMWSVEAVYGLRTADIAFLQLRRPDWWGDGPGQVKPRTARINLNPVNVGDEIRVFGFPGSRVDAGILWISPCECNARVASVSLNTAYSFRPTSYVELEGEIAPGMSGGPCFDMSWNVVGMASKGWSFLEDEPNKSPLSYMALLWPAMSVQIDLFKTGKFPVFDLFKSGGAQAIGHRRIQLGPHGQVRIGGMDPDSLIPHTLSAPSVQLEGTLNFAIENARRAQLDLETIINAAKQDFTTLTANALHTALRTFFWELDVVQRVTLQLAASRQGFSVEAPVDWDRFVASWKVAGAIPAALDAVAPLAFTWNAPELFEVRSYRERVSASVLQVEFAEADGRLLGCMLNSSRVGGAQVSLPDGLEVYFNKTLRFAQKLLRLAHPE